MRKDLSFSEFVDLLLARLYDLEQEQGIEGYVDLNAVAEGLRAKIPEKWVWDASMVLEARDLIRAIRAFGGICRAELTGEGRLFVEEKRGTGVIEKYLKARNQYVAVSGSQNLVVGAGDGTTVTQTQNIESMRKPVFDLLLEMQTIVDNDESLDERDRKELKADINAVRAQMEKREPNRSVLAALLEGLAQVPSIITKVADLTRLLNP